MEVKRGMGRQWYDAIFIYLLKLQSVIFCNILISEQNCGLFENTLPQGVTVIHCPSDEPAVVARLIYESPRKQQVIFLEGKKLDWI
jgi:hypothetical protein